MNIGDSIRLNRKNANLTMKELGEQIGLSEQAISQYELGKRRPSLETLIKISSVLNINYAQLIANTEPYLPELDNPPNESVTTFLQSISNTPERIKQDSLQSALLNIINHCGFDVVLNTDDFNDLESVDISYKNQNFSLSNTEYNDLVKDIFDSTVKCILNAEYKKL